MSIKIEKLTKKFGDVSVIPELNVSFASGRISVLLGPSGCGKTTTLRCIAGLERPSSGRIMLEDAAVFDSARGLDQPPEKRDLGMVFQSYAIWPHMTVFGNVALPLKARKVAAPEIESRVREALDVVGLGALADRSATRLSGGQQQRVAIARCLVSRPKLILLDEPLSNLDAKLRIEMRREIRDLQRSLGSTMLFVTHDQEEAMFLADEVFLFDKGVVVQAGSPQDLYFRPVNRFVAEFLGEANLVKARLVGEGGASRIVSEAGHLLATGGELARFAGKDIAMIRPEAWIVTPAHGQGAGEPALAGRVLDSTFLGDRLSLRIETPVGTQLVSLPGHAQHGPGDRVSLRVDEQNIQMIDG